MHCSDRWMKQSPVERHGEERADHGLGLVVVEPAREREGVEHAAAAGAVEKDARPVLDARARLAAPRKLAILVPGLRPPPRSGDARVGLDLVGKRLDPPDRHGVGSGAVLAA